MNFFWVHVVLARHIWAVHFGFGQLGFEETKSRECGGVRGEKISIWADQHTFEWSGWTDRTPRGHG